MTRDKDNKRGGNSDLDKYGQKVEARFDKEAKAKSGPDGTTRIDRMNRDHADDGGEHRM